jgi:hypothetical protein
LHTEGGRDLADAGEQVLHVFLDADTDVLREWLNARVTHPGRKLGQAAREFGMTGVASRPAGAGLRQVHGDGKRTRQARSLDSNET